MVADITMCADYMECPKKYTCYRVLAIVSDRQSYANFYKECKDFNFRNYWLRGGAM